MGRGDVGGKESTADEEALKAAIEESLKGSGRIGRGEWELGR